MKHIEVSAMARSGRLSTVILITLGLAMPAAFVVASLAGAQVEARATPVPPGLARVWFLRQFQPSESLRTPMISVNETPLASSVPGTAFYRDVAPGTYTFSVETCTEDTNQTATLNLAAGSQTAIEIQSLSSFHSWDCPRDDAFYVRVVSPDWAQLYLPQLSYLGAR